MRRSFPDVLASVSLPPVPSNTVPPVGLTLPALSVSTALSVRTDEPAMNDMLQVLPVPTVAVPMVVLPSDTATAAPASPFPLSEVRVPVVNVGSAGGVVSMVTASAPEAGPAGSHRTANRDGGRDGGRLGLPPPLRDVDQARLV